ncbi:MAG: hypothetical protein PVF59_05135 [Desulfobacterales bacterium]|jgi:hypothetical protein
MKGIGSQCSGAVVLWMVVVLLSGCRALNAPEGTKPERPVFDIRQTGSVRNPALIEASGMAHARREPGLLWMVNDGGHPAELFAVGTDGRDEAQVEVEGAVNTDWEDLAGFELGGRAFILIADVGDNHAVRDSVDIYVVAEPARQASGRFPSRIAIAWQFRFRYEDGPRDCEAAGVDPHAEQILLITKRTTPPQIYALPLRPAAGLVATARRVGEVPWIPPPTDADLIADPRWGAIKSQPTALDIRSDNRLAAVLTYKDAYLFPRATGETWPAALGREPLTVRLPPLKQKETAAFDPKGRKINVSTEQRPTPLLEVDLPRGLH